MALSYNVCPITGLSYTIKDDYPGTLLFGTVHPIVKEPQTLFSLCEKGGNSCPSSYLAAGILLHLEQEELLEHPEKEPEFLRGQANELLQFIPHYNLVELYWDTRNCMAHLNSQPIKLNLASTIPQGYRALYDNILVVARQSVAAADMETYLTTKGSKQSKDKLHIRQNMGLKACCSRVARSLPKVQRDIVNCTIPIKSAKRAASFLRYCPETNTPMFAEANPAIVTRLIEILDTLLTQGLDTMCIDRDSTIEKSYRLVRKYLTGEMKSVELELEF